MAAAQQLLEWLRDEARAYALRKADPAARTPLDYLVAVLAAALAIALVLAPIAAGWMILWHTTLHKIGVFREIMGLNRAQQAESKRKAQLEIENLKRQLSQQHSWAANRSFDEQDDDGVRDKDD